MIERKYPSDLTDTEYQLIESVLPPRKTEGRTGRPPRYTHREILNGIFYAERTGCAWRYLPRDLPQWTSVYAYWQKWTRDGTLDHIRAILHRNAPPPRISKEKRHAQRRRRPARKPPTSDGERRRSAGDLAPPPAPVVLA